MARVGLIASIWAAALLAACGGGGGGGGTAGTGSDPGAATTVSGHVLKGPVGGAVVRLQTVSSDGTRTDVAQTTTAPDGSYEFRTAPSPNAVLLVSASGGTYDDEATGTTRPLSSPLRAVAIWSGTSQRIVLTPYSEAGVRLVELAPVPDWTASAVSTANARVEGWLGIAGYLDFRPVDLRAATIPQTATDRDVAMSLSVGAISTFAKRLDTNPATSLATALEGLHRLAFVDPLDDRLAPAYLGALADYVDLTGLPADAKRTLKSLLLSGSDTPLGDAVLQRLIPRGVASGAASAAMPDDGFQLLGAPGGHSVFNKRGALVAYTTSANTPDWQFAYTASVAEVFGDGEVGIGRWNGGAIIATTRSADGFVPNLAFLPYDALHYAVAKSASGVPACGLRRLPLVASTQPTLQSESVGETLMIAGLSQDSALSVQFLGDTYIGADIGLRLLDGSVVRFRSFGGLDSPWAGGIRADGVERTLLAVEPIGALQNQSLSVSALVAGDGARKVVIRLKLRKTVDPTELTAVFVGPDALPQTTGCGSDGVAGPGISPLPLDSQYMVFANFDGTSTFMGAPIGATFGSAGQLASINRPQTLGPPVYDLAGNDTAAVGRVAASGDIGGQRVSRSMPYAVIQPSPTVPASGTVVYDLVHASGVIAARGGSGAQAPTGQVTTATLEITYGQYPPGTANPFYGTARLTVTGTVDGLPFVFAADPANPSSGPVEARVDGPSFSASNFAGGIGAPTGEHAAVWYQASINGVPLDGSLLFRRRP